MIVKPLPRGVLVTYCIRCLCEWRTDMEEFAPGDWRAVDPDDRNVTVCADCGGEVTMPDRIEPS